MHTPTRHPAVGLVATVVLTLAALCPAWPQTRLSVPTPAEDPFRAHHGCGDCHVSHGSGDGDSATLRLRGGTALQTCLRCHAGTSGAPDVVGSDINGLADRAGGAFGELGAAASGHALGDIPGGVPHDRGVVTCTDCHDPHGNGQPRSLRLSSSSPSRETMGLLVDPDARGLQQYEASRIGYGADPAAGLVAVSQMCLECHVMRPDRPGANGAHTMHPCAETGADATIAHGDRYGSTDSTHWLGGTGTGFEVPRLRFLVAGAVTFDEARVVSPSNQVFCLTCHKAHGSGGPGSLAWQTGHDGSYGPAGCNQCHRKGA